MQKLPPLGLWLETVNFAACEMAWRAGYRIAVLDMEHGVIDPESADRLVAFARALGMEVQVRVAAPDRVPIQMALDSGADAVILPQVQDAGHAATASAFAKFPTLGTRGLGYSRTMNYGAAPDEFPDIENKSRRCYVMIETPGALSDVSDIAALPTVDGLFVGPGDLSLTRGRGVNRWRKADFADLELVALAAKRAGKTWAFPTGNPDVLEKVKQLGPEYVIVADDLSALNLGLVSAFGSVRNGSKG